MFLFIPFSPLQAVQNAQTICPMFSRPDQESSRQEAGGFSGDMQYSYSRFLFLSTDHTSSCNSQGSLLFCIPLKILPKFIQSTNRPSLHHQDRQCGFAGFPLKEDSSEMKDRDRTLIIDLEVASLHLFATDRRDCPA